MNLHDLLLGQRREREAFRGVRYIRRSSVVEPESAGRIRVVVGPRRAGSNAHLLSSELATHLTGRHVQIPLLPFSFSEHLAAEGGRAAQTDLERREACRRYARRGGFPEVVLNALSGPEYLRTLVASVLYKDIVSRFRPRAPGAIETVARCLLSQPGGEYAFHALAKATGCRSPHTLKKHIGWLEEAFVIFTVPKFSFKPREQAVRLMRAALMDRSANRYWRGASHQTRFNPYASH